MARPGALRAEPVHPGPGRLLRRRAGLRRHPIERAALVLDLDLPGLPPEALVHVRFDGLGRGAGLTVREEALAGGGRRVRVVLPPELDVTWQLWERLHVTHCPAADEPARARPLAWFSPFEAVTPEAERRWLDAGPPPHRIAGERLVAAGLGGLGAWIAPLLAVSGLDGCTVDLYDHDTVEAHNLNRQVLYREADVGRAKAEAAAERLERLAPASRWRPRAAAIGLDHLVAAAADLGQARLLLSAFDNAYARYLPGMFAASRDIAFLDCGGGGLDGNVNLYPPGHHRILCHWGAKRSFDETLAFAHRREAEHCRRDDRGSPLLAGAIVTTSAIVASTATAIALATLGGGPPPAHQVTYLARPNELYKCPLQERLGHAGCGHHRHGAQHERFLASFLEEWHHVEALVPALGRR